MPRRHASSYTKLRKQAKKKIRTANTRARHLAKTPYAKGNHAMSRLYKSNGFGIKKAKTVNQLRVVNAKASKFLNAKTSTVRGTRHVLKSTIRNIAKHSNLQDQAIDQIQNNLTIEDAGDLVQSYFEVFYKVKDILDTEHLGSAFTSGDVMDAISESVLDEASEASDEADNYDDFQLDVENLPQYAMKAIDRLKKEF